jgi:hypothetical protein
MLVEELYSTNYQLTRTEGIDTERETEFCFDVFTTKRNLVVVIAKNDEDIGLWSKKKMSVGLAKKGIRE